MPPVWFFFYAGVLRVVFACETFYVGETFSRLCKGTYPAFVKDKYHDTMVVIGDPYAIFQNNNPDFLIYVLAHRWSPLLSCVTMLLNDTKYLPCGATSKELKLLQPQADVEIYCLFYHMQLVEDLLASCGRKDLREQISDLMIFYYTAPLRARGASTDSEEEDELWGYESVICAVSFLVICIAIAYVSLKARFGTV